MTTINRAVTIIDAELDGMLERPGMWCGDNLGAFEILVLNYLSLRARIKESSYDWRKISHTLLVEMTGAGSGALGPNSRLREFYGQDAFKHEHPNHGNLMLFYREFVARVREATSR